MTQPLKLELTAGGLGTVISYLSAVMNNGDPVELATDRESIATLKSLFRISDSRLTLVPATTPGANDGTTVISDMSKIFSNYFEVEVLHAHGQDFQVPYQRGRKPFIGLSCYQEHNHNASFDPASYAWPHFRYYSLDEYARIVKFIKNLGYEVITLDDRRITLEQKAYLLNELCSAVIGYEGGMQHLAHLLKVPSIILPWRLNPNKSSQTTYYEHLLHLDRRTYFARSIDEIVAWTCNEFEEVLVSLRACNGNNVFYRNLNRPTQSTDIIMANDLSMLAITVNSQLIKQRLPFKAWDLEFLKQHHMHHHTRILNNPVTFVDPMLLTHVL